jgi:cell division protein YceG involved in septum cleavage
VKKKLTTMLVIVLILVVVAAAAWLVHEQIYNKSLIDLTYAYNTAIIKLPNGEVVQGRVESWTDYQDGDQIQVKVNGKVYLVHSANVALIKE